MSARLETCALCPRLCRPACPVAVGTGREAATPSAIAAVLVDVVRGLATQDDARDAASLCVDCGGCQTACHIDQPLPELLRGVRRTLFDAEPIEPIEGPEPGPGAVVVQTDDVPLADLLIERTGRPWRGWRTGDSLGGHAIGTDAWALHAEQLARIADGEVVWVADGVAAKALQAANVQVRWLHELSGAPSVIGSCATAGQRPPPLGCCGGAGPLAAHHEADAARVGAAFARRLPDDAVLADRRCSRHLASVGISVRDVLHWLNGGTS